MACLDSGETLAGAFSLFQSPKFFKNLCGLDDVGNGISSVNLEPAAMSSLLQSQDILYVYNKSRILRERERSDN